MNVLDVTELMVAFGVVGTKSQSAACAGDEESRMTARVVMRIFFIVFIQIVLCLILLTLPPRSHYHPRRHRKRQIPLWKQPRFLH